MKKLYIDNLCLEITRKCNMACAHCLRGDAESKEMSNGLLSSVFSGLTSVGTLTFTGGEPTLAVAQMEEALRLAKSHQVSVNMIYVVTNGKVVTDDFLTIMRKWHDYCMASYSCDKDLVKGKDLYRAASILQQEESFYGTYIALSADTYHEPIPFANVIRLQTLPHFTTEKMNVTNDTNWVLAEGRAQDWGRASYRYWEHDEGAMRLDIDNDQIDSLYISAMGAVLKHCDYAYTTQDKYTLEQIKESDNTWTERLISRCESNP